MLDDNHYEQATAYSRWHLTTAGYVRSNSGGGIPHSKRQIFLHEIVIGPCPAGLECDHRDSDRLNYQQSNLHYISRSQNQRKKLGLLPNNTSGYRGVVWMNCRGYSYWNARIKVNGKQISLGYFKDPVLAAKRYDEAARLYHGEFATLNFKEN